MVQGAKGWWLESLNSLEIETCLEICHPCDYQISLFFTLLPGVNRNQIVASVQGGPSDYGVS